MSGRSDPSSASHHNPSGQGSSAAGPTATPDDRVPDPPDRTTPVQAPALGNAAAAFIAAGRDAAPRRPNPAAHGGGTSEPAREVAAPAPGSSADEPPAKPPAQPTEAIEREVTESSADRTADAPDERGSSADAAARPAAAGAGGHPPDAAQASNPSPGASAERADEPQASDRSPGASAERADEPQASDRSPGASAERADEPQASNPPPGASPESGDQPQASGFRLRLSNFEGPFDLLLTLISSRKLDVTEVALHKVTDEFIAYTKALTANMAQQNTLRSDKILDQTTEFLVVAATLLDLKAARLLPSGEMTDAEDLELLEARDLLFARLLQYRAFKQVAELLGELEGAALRRYPRAVGLEERYAGLLPEVTLGVRAAEFAAIAAAAFRPRPVPKVGLDHLHTHAISVAEQAALVLERLKQRGAGAWTSFGELVADCEVPVQIVARFLALLELYRGKTIEFDQPDPLGPLAVSWIGDEAAQQADTMTIEEDYG